MGKEVFNNFQILQVYITRVLRQVQPDTGISSKAMSMMNSLVFPFSQFKNRKNPQVRRRRVRANCCRSTPPKERRGRSGKVRGGEDFREFQMASDWLLADQ